MQVLRVRPPARGVLTCNLREIATVLFLVHCSVQHSEFLIHKYVSSWWYIWKSHRVLPPPLAPLIADSVELLNQSLFCSFLSNRLAFWSGQ